MRKNNHLNIFKSNQMYEWYKAVEEYMIILPQNFLIIFPDRTLSDNIKYY